MRNNKKVELNKLITYIPPKLDIQTHQLRTIIKELKKILIDNFMESNPNITYTFLKQFIDSIEVYDDHIEIIYSDEAIIIPMIDDNISYFSPLNTDKEATEEEGDGKEVAI